MQKESDNKNTKPDEQAANAAKELNENELNEVAGGQYSYHCPKCKMQTQSTTCPKCGGKTDVKSRGLVKIYY